jgi:hypothetical protein
MVSRVYWWDSEDRSWVEVSWNDWVASSGIRAPVKRLPRVRPGDTRFVVCVVDDDGSIANIIPHRYLIDGDRYRRRADEPITDEERTFESNYCLKRETTEAEDRRHEEINDKIYRWSLPPAATARILLSVLPAPPSMSIDHGIRHFIAARGVSLPSGRLQ